MWLRHGWNITVTLLLCLKLIPGTSSSGWGICRLILAWPEQVITATNEKKCLEETQTLRAGCSKAEPKIFILSQTPFPGAQDGQNLISWRWSLPLPTNPVW